jgi:hypothetical protein
MRCRHDERLARIRQGRVAAAEFTGRDRRILGGAEPDGGGSAPEEIHKQVISHQARRQTRDVPAAGEFERPAVPAGMAFGELHPFARRPDGRWLGNGIQKVHFRAMEPEGCGILNSGWRAIRRPAAQPAAMVSPPSTLHATPVT